MEKGKETFLKRPSRREFLTWTGATIATAVLVPPTVQKILEKLGTNKAEATPLAENWLQEIGCNVRVLIDFDPRYDINVSEVERLLEDNGVTCPYWVNIKLTPKLLWVKKGEEGVLFSVGRAKCLTDFCILEISTSEKEMVDTPGHDFSVLKTLKGIERHNWISAHEHAHLICYFKGLLYKGPEVELWCDQFANENYNKYEIIVEEGK